MPGAGIGSEISCTQANFNKVANVLGRPTTYMSGSWGGPVSPYMTGGREGWVDETTPSAFISKDNGLYGGTFEDADSK